MPATLTATTRYGLAQAPGGLALVQDVVNTRAADRPRQADLLHGNVRVTQDWFADLAHAWSAATDAPTTELPPLSRTDLPGIRNLRETLTRVLRRDEATGATAALATTSVRLELTSDGTAHLAPGGSAAQWLTGVVLGEILRAQATGVWRRLKVCRNVACSGAFYDLSKNNSRVWHDAHRCGNIANLRASRARRRASGTLLVTPEA